MPRNGLEDKDVRTTQEYEGWREKSYNDTKGIKTIGFGTNLDRPEMKKRIEELGLNYNAVRNGTQSITKEQGEKLFQYDMDKAVEKAPSIVKTYDEQPPIVKQAIHDLIYNMGPTVFSTFKNTISKLNQKDYQGVAQGLAASKYAKQTGRRAKEIIQMFKDLA